MSQVISIRQSSHSVVEDIETDHISLVVKPERSGMEGCLVPADIDVELFSSVI